MPPIDWATLGVGQAEEPPEEKDYQDERESCTGCSWRAHSEELYAEVDRLRKLLADAEAEAEQLGDKETDDEPLETGGLLRVSLTLRSQSCVERSAGVQIVTGDLIIMGMGVVNLSPLKSLKEVRGDLRIENTNLVNLVGLENLRRVDGQISIIGNARLTDISGPSAFGSKQEAIIRENPGLHNEYVTFYLDGPYRRP